MEHSVSTAGERSRLELPALYAPYLDRTRKALCARLADAPAGNLLRDYFERGKMLRAFLVFAATSAVEGDPGKVVMAAEAIELLHGASLFHDDIIDHAAERRGIPALHERLGVGQALVVGDDLLLRAFSILSEASAYFPPSQVLEAIEALNQLARECCRGQFHELCAGRWISEEQYLTIVAGKTAAPFVAAGVLGVLLGGGTPVQAAGIRTYAHHLGIAFQIEDDLLDLIGEAVDRGKPVGNSLDQGRPMLPLLYLRRLSSEAAREDLSRLDQGILARERLTALMEEHRIVECVRKVQRQHLDAALEALKVFRHPGSGALRQLSERVIAAAPPGS
jgi:geranylgeranyl pyrophosphate synthase